MQKITPFLWFDSQAEAAANFYVSIFKNSKVVNIALYGEAGPGPKGNVAESYLSITQLNCRTRGRARGAAGAHVCCV